MTIASKNPVVEETYKNPPIKVRSLEVNLRMEPSEFEQLAPTWIQQVIASNAYPKQELLQYWDFFIRENKEGIPVPKGVLSNSPRLYEQSVAGHLSRSIELNPPKNDSIAKIVFTLYRPTKSVTRYTQLRSEVARWLPVWSQNFHGTGFGGIKLRYNNEVSAKEYPDFWGPRGLELGRVLNFFTKNPATGGQFHPPFRTELNLVIDDSIPTYMRTSMVSSVADKKTFHVIFEYTSDRRAFNREVEACLKEMDEAHILILEHFEKHFTKEALGAFNK